MLLLNQVKKLSSLKKLAVTCLTVALIAGCSTNQGNAPVNSPENSPKAGTEEIHQPVTITVGVKGNGYLNDEEMKRYIIDPVKKKYPWITVEKVIYAGEGTKLSELVVAGTVPDLIMTNNINGFPELQELQLMTPLGELIKEHKLDLNRFEPETLNAIKVNSMSEELVGIPFTRHIQALYYNKDIFDKFGVPYPKDGMTWDDAIALAKKVTRKDGDIQYSGLQANVIQRPASQLSLPYVDPNTKKAIFNTTEWKNVLEKLAEIYRIPGNEEIVGKNKANIKFTKDRNLAMLAANNIFFSAGLDQLTDFNWDIVSMPTWDQAPGKEPRIDETLLVLSTTSKNPDDAFRVMTKVVSDEVQMDMAVTGRVSVMNQSKFKDAFGKDMPFMQGKNMDGLYKTTPAKSFVPSIYDNTAFEAMDTALNSMVKKGVDINTALRQAEETVNQEIQKQAVSK